MGVEGDGPKVIGPTDGERRTLPDGSADRFLVDAAVTGGRLAVVEHILAPGALAAPLHRHTREDEFSFVLEGRVGAVFDGREAFVDAGDLLFKPRDQWHTFWNAGTGTARILELISPGGIEDAFRAIDELLATDALSEERLLQIAGEHHIDLDLEGTAAVAARHNLSF